MHVLLMKCSRVDIVGAGMPTNDEITITICQSGYIVHLCKCSMHMQSQGPP